MNTAFDWKEFYFLEMWKVLFFSSKRSHKKWWRHIFLSCLTSFWNQGRQNSPNSYIWHLYLGNIFLFTLGDNWPSVLSSSRAFFLDIVKVWLSCQNRQDWEKLFSLFLFLSQLENIWGLLFVRPPPPRRPISHEKIFFFPLQAKSLLKPGYWPSSLF